MRRCRGKGPPQPHTSPDEHVEMTFEDIADVLGVTSQNVGQIYRKAIAKVRAMFDGNENDLREWLLDNMSGPRGRSPARATMPRRYE